MLAESPSSFESCTFSNDSPRTAHPSKMIKLLVSEMSDYVKQVLLVTLWQFGKLRDKMKNRFIPVLGIVFSFYT